MSIPPPPSTMQSRVGAPPPPVGAPRDTTPPTAPAPPPVRRRRRTVVAIAAIAAGALVVTGGVVWGAVSLGQAAAHRAVATRPRTPAPGPIADGPRISTHHAPSPLVCADECFIATDATAAVGPDHGARSMVGAPTYSDYGAYTASNPVEDYGDTLKDWRTAKPSGDDCLFTFSVTPSAAVASGPPADDGSTTQFVDEYVGEDQYPVLDTAARVFPTSRAADAYVDALEGVIAACRHYRLAAKDDTWDADVSALSGWGELPADVTAIGWVEQDVSGDGYYGVDLQRGNLVVRYSLATDSLARAGFQRFVSRMARQLESADHSPSA